MEKTYDERTAINAMTNIVSAVLGCCTPNPEFNEYDEADISDGSCYMPIICVSREEIAALADFMEENCESEKAEFLRGMIKTEEQG